MSASYQDDPHLNIFKSLLRGSAHSDSFRPTCKVGRKLRNVLRLCSNPSSNGSQLVTKPCVSGFVSESRMPCHEVRKSFDLAWRFHHAQTSQRNGDLCQSARDGQDQIGFSDGEDCGHKERKTKRDAALYAKLRQRTIHHGLLTIQSFDQCVRQLQVLFECESTRPNGLGGSDQTNKV